MDSTAEVRFNEVPPVWDSHEDLVVEADAGLGLVVRVDRARLVALHEVADLFCFEHEFVRGEAFVLAEVPQKPNDRAVFERVDQFVGCSDFVDKLVHLVFKLLALHSDFEAVLHWFALHARRAMGLAFCDPPMAGD